MKFKGQIFGAGMVFLIGIAILLISVPLISMLGDTTQQTVQYYYANNSGTYTQNVTAMNPPQCDLSGIGAVVNIIPCGINQVTYAVGLGHGIPDVAGLNIFITAFTILIFIAGIMALLHG